MVELSPVLKQATPVIASRGEGVYLYDEDDRRYSNSPPGSEGRVPDMPSALVGPPGAGREDDPWPVPTVPSPADAAPGSVRFATEPGPEVFANTVGAIEAALRLPPGTPTIDRLHGGFQADRAAAR